MAAKEVFDQRYSRYYNLFYSDKNYGAEVAYIAGLLKQWAPGAKELIEFGSGTGGHGVLLKEQGYSIFGIEQSSAMAGIARERGLECEVADITNFSLDRKFDACLSLFHVISYINANNDLIKVFGNARKHLKTGGHFIFDVWFTPAVMHQMPAVRVKTIKDAESEITRIATPVIDYQRNVVDVNYQILIKDLSTGMYSDFRESHKMRHFGVPEIELLAAQSGFKVLKAEEFLTGAAPSENTWGVTFVLKLHE